MDKDLLFEKLAAIEHERWAAWQRHFHGKCRENGDGSLIVPPEYVECLEKQINTSYSELSERDKNADRQEVKKYWDLINTIPRARAIMREALEADEGFKLGYIANIAVIIRDNLEIFGMYVGKTIETRNKVAEKILDRIFE